MSVSEAASLLNRRIGLDPESIGQATIARCVRRRMSDLGMADEAAYTRLLRASDAEMEELAEEVIVPETWFFRDREPFRLLGQHAASEWLPENPGGVFRVLSVPCSTGEEPYSVAMALLDAGLRPGGFHVDAVDLSKRALSAARRAVYGRNSFRGEGLAYRDRFFEPAEEGWRLLPPAAGSVQFVQGNLLNSPFFLTSEPYDAILCRNLLIYFDRPARERTVGVLDRLLKPSGLLFVGHAETPQLWGERFAPIRRPGAFAFRRRGENQVQGQRSGGGSCVQGPGKGPGSRVPGSESTAGEPDLSDSGPRTQGLGRGGEEGDPSAVRLAAAARLADEGRLSEAAALCESFLRDSGPDARAYYLLGLVRQASGDEGQAESLFNRAVYLDPDHGDALVHLALLAEHRGDRSGSVRLRQRYQRVQARSKRRISV